MTTVAKKSFYTANGWEGDKYNPKLSVKDIAKIIRDELKKKFPKCKFSIKKEHHSAMSISLMQAPFNPFTEENRTHVSINHYRIKDEAITDEAKEVMSYVDELAQSYNFDDSDSMIDYFHTNFYLTLAIGKWDKPFVQK
jgi:hypothetical protein